MVLKSARCMVDILPPGHPLKIPLGGYLVGQKSHPNRSNEFSIGKIYCQHLQQLGRGWVRHKNHCEKSSNLLERNNFSFFVPKSAGISVPSKAVEKEETSMPYS
jgi:hypothetical protein